MLQVERVGDGVRCIYVMKKGEEGRSERKREGKGGGGGERRRWGEEEVGWMVGFNQMKKMISS